MNGHEHGVCMTKIMLLKNCTKRNTIRLGIKSRKCVWSQTKKVLTKPLGIYKWEDKLKTQYYIYFVSTSYFMMNGVLYI